jgi:hypothetical protein
LPSLNSDAALAAAIRAASFARDTPRMLAKIASVARRKSTGRKTERILAGVLTVASGGWLILILLGYLGSPGWGHVLGLFVLFGIGVASLLTGKRRT